MGATSAPRLGRPFRIRGLKQTFIGHRYITRGQTGHVESAIAEPIDETDYTQSSFRENLFEHIFISEFLQGAWVKRRQVIDVLRSEVDSSGYDVVLVSGAATRHVQLKSSKEGSKRRYQTVNAKLAERPGGCVVWMFIQEDPLVGRISLRFEFFGGRPDAS